MAKKKTPFAVDCNTGVRYVRTDAVMQPICAMIDELPVTFFGNGKHSYLKVDDAIAWCQQEKKYHSKEKYEKIIAVLEKFKNQNDDGDE